MISATLSDTKTQDSRSVKMEGRDVEKWSQIYIWPPTKIGAYVDANRDQLLRLQVYLTEQI